MPKLLRSSETTGCGATIKLDNGEVVYVSIAQVGVLVRHVDMSGGIFKTLLSNFFGAKLYNESSVYKNAQAARALSILYPQRVPELQFKNPVLAAFSNAIWHCRSAAEVCTVLNEAAADPTASNNFIEAVPDILVRYGELLERYPGCYLDETWLPVSKPLMKEALKRGWLLATSDELRESVKIGWTWLSTFQKGIGGEPINMADRADPLTDEGIAKLKRIAEIGRLCEAEMKADRDEMYQFIREQTKR